MLKTKEQKLQHIKALDVNVLEYLKEIESCAEAGKAKSKQKQDDLQKKRNKVLQLSIKRFTFTPKMLTIAVMKALITAV
jgi:hypothetical protein